MLFGEKNKGKFLFMDYNDMPTFEQNNVNTIKMRRKI